MSKNSDYKKPFTNLFDLLPNTLQTEVNESMLENVFNRFLTKSESKYVYGTIGKKSTHIPNDNRLKEPTIHRQGFQLQPLIYKKIASVDHIVSYYDILQKAERLGIDREKLKEWGNTEQFNFAPPIDFDKLINWNNYYWYDPYEKSTPEYITIKNICTVFQSRVNLKQKMHADLVAGGQATAEEIAISAAELSYLETMRDCSCYNGGVGWDKALWDDNPPGWITQINPGITPPNSPNIGVLWYDTSQQKLKYYNGTQWEILSFANLSQGIFAWDSIIGGCDQPNNEWSKQNKWVHRNDVPNFALAKRAEMPIIEYNPFIEMNQWSYTKYIWAYRKDKIHNWEIVDVEPSIYEIGTKFKVFQISNNNEIVIQGNHLSVLSNGTKIKITILPSLTQFDFTIDSIINSNSQQTMFRVFEPTTNASLLLNNPSNSALCEVLLEETSLGDPWEGFFKHWALVETKTPVPVNRQQRPTNIVRDVDELVTVPKTIFSLNKAYLVKQDVIRVYIDERRQYGNYEEGWYDGFTFTSVNDINYNNIPGTNGGLYGNAIRFYENVVSPSIVTIESEPAALSDIPFKEVVVRTSLDEDFDTVNFETKTVTLIKYRLVEQVKTQLNQYPLFDIFHVDGTTAYEANSIFTFEESPEYPVNPKIGKRIKVTERGRQYHFEQFLIKEDNGELFCYKDKWSIEPSNPEGLQTIWRTGIPPVQYIPRYVNEYRLADGDTYIDPSNTVQIAHVPYGGGDWEVAEQLFYNPHHENRKKLKFSELVTHFNSIIQKQQLPGGLEGANTEVYYLLDRPNYGVGGTIREFNDSYDTFISSLLQTVATPRTIIDFAQRQYESNLKFLKDLCIQHAVNLLTSQESEALSDLYSFVSRKIITLFEQNDALDFAFGDSTTYDTETRKGIKNWITTLPYLGLVKPIEPVLLIDKALGITKVLHHDGHMSSVFIDRKTIETLQQEIVKVTQATVGSTKPAWDVVKRGEFWYNPSTKKLYRFSVVSTQSTPPSVSHPIGSYWLNQSTGILYVRDNTTAYGWTPVNNVIGDVEAAWKLIDINEMAATVIYNVEKKLYEAVPNFNEKTFDFNSLLATPQTREIFVNHLKEHFFEYVQTINADIFSTPYDPSNPFTWNYSEFTNIPTVKTNGEPTQWSGTWEGIYEANFGTRYPHLMPWRLQGYTDKPLWWDTEYKDTTGTRRWKPIMWNNIKIGLVPTGYQLPNGNISNGNPGNVSGYHFMCVDVTNDTLLPPYVEGNTNTFFRNFSVDVAPLISTLRQPFAFGQQGFVEMQWRDSTFFSYALLHIAFKMQPVRFLHSVFGPKFIKVAHLQINEKTRKVYSHRDVEFHGDVDEKTNTTVISNGLNQWYVNFIRYNNFDVNTSDFKELWTKWDTFLSYQTGSIINVSSTQVSTKNYSLTERDYNIILKKTPNMEDYWIDALLVTVQTPGSDWTVRNNYKVPRYDGSDWVFRVDIPSTVGRKIKYYGVKRYACSFNPATDKGTLIGNVTLPWAVIDQENSSISGEETNYIPHHTLTWYTGFPVQISSNGGFPAPLKPDTTYYIIKVSNNEFKLASSYNEAIAGIAIDIETTTTSTVYVEEVAGTFIATNGSVTSRIWKHYGIDRRQVNEIFTPSSFTGIQTLINLIDGYAEYLKDQGWIFNDPDIVEIDIETNQLVSWQNEIERLINRIYSGLGRTNYQIDDVYQQEHFIKPYHEVNPFRNNVWFRTNTGVISNILVGSYVDVRAGTTLYDQTGKPLPIDSVFAFRTDKKTHIRTCSLSGSKYAQNSMIRFQQNVEETRPYSSPHLAGAHIFIDGYEHIIMFNRKTTDEQLIYDPFLGLAINKFTVSFERGNDYTFKPNVGGFYMLNGQMIQNIEQSVENIQYYYDTFKINETAKFIDYARSLLGYVPPKYLDSVNANSKSKFIFWKGMIQNKGSVNAIKAFINARLFIDAKIDEFWAYRVAEYGNKKNKKYYDVLVQPKDFNKNELRLHFIGFNDLPEPTFKQISINDENRWLYFPDQRENVDPTLNFYFDTEIKNMIRIPLQQVTNNVDNGFFDVPVENFIIGGTLMVFIQNDSTYHRVPLIENVHFYRKTSTILSFFVGYDENTGFGSLFNGFSPYDDKNAIYVYNILLSSNKHNPAKLIDMKTGITVNKIFIWHPAANLHYHVPLKEIDVISDTDPAKYNITIDDNDPNFNDRTPSNYIEKDKIWLKKNTFDYIPYYNPAIFPDVSDRIYYWGRATDWSTFEVYQWTESPVPPELWEDYVLEQQNNTEIDSYSKPSGTPLRVIYRRVNESTDEDIIAFGDYQKIDTNPKDMLVFESIPLYGIDSNNILQKLPLCLFGANTRKDQIVPNGTSLNVYINGFLKGKTTAISIISSIKLQPPEEVTIGDLYFVPDQGADGVWKGKEGEYVQWNGSEWVVRVVLDKSSLEPPVSPDVGDLYYVPKVAMGDWINLENKYVEWDGIQWNEILFEGNTFNTSPTADGLYYIPKAVGMWESLEGNYVEWRGTYWVIRNPIDATSLPVSPNVGDLYRVSGVIREWNGSSWVIKNPIDGSTLLPSTSPADLTPPTSPNYGDMYYIPKPTGVLQEKQGKYVSKSGTNWIIRELKDMTLSIPPEQKDKGDLYLVMGAKQQWKGKEGKYVEWNGTQWNDVILENDVLLIPPTSPGSGLYYIPDIGPKGKWKQFRGKYVEWDGEQWIEVTGSKKQALEAQGMTGYPGGAYVDLKDLGIEVKGADSITIELPIYQINFETLNQPNSVEYTEFTPYTQLESYDSNGITVSTKYYFWVGNKNIKPEITKLSLQEISSMLRQPTEPYMFMEGFRPAGSPPKSPARFTQVIIRGISNQVFEENRFKIRFQYNDTLRDAENIKQKLTQKNVHEEWQLFRKNQSFKISKYLWNKLTESVIGHKLNDPTKPVPSYERVLYDQMNGTATRIGLDEGQTFVDKELALNTIIAELQNPDYDLYPVDKSVFLETYKFDTPENIRLAMNQIYDTFTHSDVNRIFFACLHDAMSLKKEYDGIMKTSTIALHGIKLLETINRAIDD